MEKVISILVLILLYLLPLQAQQAIHQKGKTRLLNSKKTPVANVYIKFLETGHTRSDDIGNFDLAFVGKKAGDLIFLESIYKKGFELVNKKDFEVTKISNTDQLKVDFILAKIGVVDSIKKLYYEVSDSALLAGFKRQKRSLQRRLSQAELKQGQYLDQLEILREEYELQKGQLDKLSERFARINFDDVDSLYQDALMLFQGGKINQAIQTLERANPAKRTGQILKERERINLAKKELARQEELLDQEIKKQIKRVRLLADMYSITFNRDSAESQFDQLILLDSTKLEILREAEKFYRQQHRYKKAFRVNRLVLVHPGLEAWQAANAYGFLGELHSTTGKLIPAKIAFLKADSIYQSLAKKEAKNSFYWGNLAVTYSKLGQTHTSLGNLDSALIFFNDQTILFQELFE
ncbi:MAG: hypothetical protein MRZ79_07515, partial [Bacteroidia bacterium]|nr:hypothetical protein [Bacteroidia bacterium]